MKLRILFLLLATSVFSQAALGFKLPPKAKYTASAKSIAEARKVLDRNLVADAGVLSNLFVTPTMCGPGLWHLLKDSPCFAKPPLAKSTAKVPLPNGKVQKLPMALLQNNEEVASFRKAFATLLASQGKLTVRDPNEEEFKVLWAVIPFDEIKDPLLIAEGKDCSFICVFNKDKVFWVDEVKKMHFKK